MFEAAAKAEAAEPRGVPPIYTTTAGTGHVNAAAATPGDPIKVGAYGPSVNADEYGRPHTYRTESGEDVGIFNGGVKRDAYGLGVHMDQFGRPVHDSKP